MLANKTSFPEYTITYHLMIDSSISMETHQPELQQALIRHIKSLNRLLAYRVKSIHISCCFFSSEKQDFGESSPKVISLLRHISKVKSIGNTNIFDALMDNMEWLEKEFQDPSKYPSNKIYLVLITDGHENTSNRYTAQEVNKSLSKLRREYGLELIIISAYFHGLDADIRLPVSGWGQYAKNTAGVLNALEVLLKYICGYLS